MSQTESNNFQKNTMEMATDEVQTKPENGEQQIKAEMLSDRARLLISESDYEGATSLLEDPCVLKSDYFLPKLMLAECSLYLGNDCKGKKLIDEIRKAILTSLDLKPDDVMKWAIDFKRNSFYIRSIILLRIASDMYKAGTSTADDLVNSIFLCLDKTCQATEPMVEAGGTLRAIGVDYGIEYMKEILSDLRSVENASTENKAWKEAWSCHFIEVNFYLAGENKKGMEYVQTGIEILDKQFGSNASEYRIYGLLLNNLGYAHKILDKHSEAESYYAKAVEAKENAIDYSDENKKQKDVELSKRNLNLACAAFCTSSY